MATPSGANAPYKIVKRGDKYVVVNNAGETKASFDSMDKARAYQKALYANVPGAPKRAAKVGFTGQARDRVAASLTSSVTAMQMRAHGFVYPSNMPPCNQCGEDPNRGAHVNPPKINGSGFAMAVGEQRVISARRSSVRIHRSHAYGTGYVGFGASIPCQACGQPMSASVHVPGLPVGTGGGAVPMMTGTPQRASVIGAAASPASSALVTDVGGKLILSAPAALLDEQTVGEWEKAAAKNKHFMWIEGAYVEAETPNRNAAMWSTKDLESGQDTVVNGPLNWLHEERHVIGTIAGARLVHGTKDGERAHIRTLSAMWRFLYPSEARQVAAASEERKLWHSMECISREVACITEGCGKTQSYADYMREKAQRCEHIQAGGPRRFVDPQFLGGAVILGVVRPGWAGAHAEVLRQAASLVQEHEKDLPGLSEEEAVSMVSQILDYAGAAA